MRVALFTAPRTLEIVERPKPRLARPNDVLLRIDRLGVCGSDVHYYLNGRIAEQLLEYPASLGHECSGTVEEVGGEAAPLAPGDRVAVDPAFSCGQCDQCREGRRNTCRRLQFMGCPGEAPGAAAEFRLLPAANCEKIPDSMSLDEAALVEPLSVGLHAVRLAQLASNATVVVFGAGPIGLSVLLCCKALESPVVYVTDLFESRLAVARRCGADWTGSVVKDRAADADGVMEGILQQRPLGVDVAFECSGDPTCVDQAARLLRPGGTLVLVGVPTERETSFDSHRMRRRELTVRNVRRQNGCVAPAIRLVAEGRIDVRPLLTHHFPLDRIGEAFELVAGYRDGVIKAMIEL